jgi:hypothetical protein
MAVYHADAACVFKVSVFPPFPLLSLSLSLSLSRARGLLISGTNYRSRYLLSRNRDVFASTICAVLHQLAVLISSLGENTSSSPNARWAGALLRVRIANPCGVVWCGRTRHADEELPETPQET